MGEIEIWRNTEGIPHYQVSNLGNLKSLPRMRKCGNNGFYETKEKLLKLQVDHHGYYYVNLRNASTQKYYKKVKGTEIKTGQEIFFNSIQEAKHNGFHAGDICKCCKGQRKTSKGYRWEYIN